MSVQSDQSIVFQIDLKNMKSSLDGISSKNQSPTHFLVDGFQWSNLTGSGASEPSNSQCEAVLNAVAENQLPTHLLHMISDPTQIDSLQKLDAKHCSGLYIPGAHCRQGDILTAAGESGLDVWVERGAFLSPTDFEKVINRVNTKAKLTLVDCGSQFGYADRVLDPRALSFYESWGLPFSLSVNDLQYGGENFKSSFRSKWADGETVNLAIQRCAKAWNTGLVFKSVNTQPEREQ